SAGCVDGSIPDRTSAALQWTVTLPLYQPAPFGAVVAAPLSDGATRSMLMPLTVAVAVLSALSETDPVRDWPAPSDDTVCAAGHPGAFSPEGPLSAHVKLTTTGTLFQPNEFATGDRPPVMVGAEPSTWTVTEAVRELPRRSAAVAVATWSPSDG